MKRSTVILWIVAALFLVSSMPLFTQGNVAAGVCGVVIAAILFVIGLRKNQTEAKPEREAPPSNAGATYKVYIERGGKKFHSDKTCSGMKNPEYVPLEYALRKGYTRCKKCSR